MEKPFWQSKTFWSALLTGLIGTYIGVDQAIGDKLPDIPGWVLLLLSALGIYGRATATGPLSWGPTGGQEKKE